MPPAGVGVGAADGLGDGLGLGLAFATATWTTVTSTPDFGFPLVMTGHPRGAPPDRGVVADFGRDDVRAGRHDIGDRVADRECGRQPTVDSPDVDAERLTGGGVDEHGHRVGGRRHLHAGRDVCPDTAPFSRSGR